MSRKNDLYLLSEAYTRVWEALDPRSSGVAKYVSTSKAGPTGPYAVYELNPQLQGTDVDLLGIAKDEKGEVTLIDANSEFLNTIETPAALQNVDYQRMSPDDILQALGYRVDNSQKDVEAQTSAEDAEILDIFDELRATRPELFSKFVKRLADKGYADQFVNQIQELDKFRSGVSL